MSREWVDRAVCAGMYPEDFDTDIMGVEKAVSLLRPALNACKICPVMAECRRWADSEIRQSPEMNLVAAGGLYMRGKRFELVNGHPSLKRGVA